MCNISNDGTEGQELNTIEEETCTATFTLKVHIDVIDAHWSCKFNSLRFHMEKKGRKREEGGLLGASSYIIKQTHTH